MNILDILVESTRKRYEERRKNLSINVLKAKVASLEKGEPKLYELCKKKDFIYICECKKASPSKGLIEPNYHPEIQSKLYIEAGADCISCLTEPTKFLGNDDHLKMVIDNANGKALVLRKDFVCSKYQIYESKLLGADIILLICAILDKKTLKEYLDLAHSLGLSCLVETHNEEEIEKAKACGAVVVGVNNRNLKDFTVDNSLSLRLREKYPELFLISESGVKSIDDVKAIKNAKLNGVLMGEVLMRSGDPKKTLEEFKKC